MKLNVIECKKSFKFSNMFVVKYRTSKVDFFTGKEEVSEHSMFSVVPVEPGLRDVVKGHNEDYSKFWIKEVK